VPPREVSWNTEWGWGEERALGLLSGADLAWAVMEKGSLALCPDGLAVVDFGTVSW
jgi:hypothetical protein